jgi:hypothetical protein
MMLGKKEVEKKICSYEHEQISLFLHYKCNREALPGDEHCIFHSKDIERKKDKFNDAFWEEFERQKEHEEEYNFTGIVFPGDISFEDKEFEKDISLGMQNSQEWLTLGVLNSPGRLAFGVPNSQRRLTLRVPNSQGRLAFGVPNSPGWLTLGLPNSHGRLTFWVPNS